MNCKLQPGGQNAVTSLYKGKMLPSGHANDCIYEMQSDTDRNRL